EQELGLHLVGVLQDEDQPDHGDDDRSDQRGRRPVAARRHLVVAVVHLHHRLYPFDRSRWRVATRRAYATVDRRRWLSDASDAELGGPGEHAIPLGADGGGLAVAG